MSTLQFKHRLVVSRYLILGGLFIVLALMAATVVTGSQAAVEGTEVGGDIKNNTTWTVAGSPYHVTEKINVLSGAILTIQPGVVVKFDPGKRLRIAGTLLAQGNASNPITFTSSQPSPGRGDWANIVFDNAAQLVRDENGVEGVLQNILQHCVVEFAGSDSAIRAQGSPLLIDNCKVRSNAGGSIRISGTGGHSVTISNNTVEDTHVVGSGGGIYAKDTSILGNIVRNNSATDYGGGIFAVRGTVRDNVVLNNSAGLDGGGIYAEDSFVSGNFARGNSARRGGGVNSVDSDFSFNTLVENSSTDRGAGVYFVGSTLFQQNTIIANAGRAGYVFGGINILGTPTVTLNNIYSNSPFDLVLDASSDINGKNNYWATTDTGTILGRIFDKFDDPGRGLVNFQPFLLDATEPVPPPLGLQGTLNSGSIDLSWQPLPASSAVYTYTVNYSTTSGPPYDGTGLPEGDSPIAVGSATNYSLTGISGSPYYITVTAEDSDGNVSWYSNEVNTLMKYYLPDVEQNYTGVQLSPVGR